MRTLGFMLVVVAFGMLAVPVSAGGDDCQCKAIKASGQGWCDACGGGVMFGVPIKSAKLYKSLEGAKVKDQSKVTCSGCKTALKDNGSCSHCRVAFNDGKVYHAVVSHTLSKGAKADAKGIKCPACVKTLKEGKDNFCAACDGGFVGGLAFHGKKLFDQAKEAMGVLKVAAKSASGCEACAVAMVTDGKCDKCKVQFKAGKKVEGGKIAKSKY